MSWIPQRKVASGGLAGIAFGPIIVAIAQGLGYDIDPLLAAAIGSAISTLLTYFIPNPKGG